jgi:DNA-directed RNA polymerase sigma subunit (sigma70/sigma32)
VDAVLDKYLYIDRDAMVALRRTSNRHDGHVMSLAEIGKKLGASHEAIRQNLAYTEDRLARTSERKRTVASGAQRLRQELGLDS